MAGGPQPYRVADADRSDRAAQILHLQRRMANCHDLTSLLAVLAAGLPALAPVRDRVSLALVDPDGPHLRVYRVLPVQDRVPQDPPRVRMDGTVVGDVARDGQPRVVADVRSEDNLRFGRAAHDGIRSTASVPVVVAGRVVGVMNFGSREVGACHAGMLDDLLAIATAVGPAVLAAEHALGSTATPLASRAPPAAEESAAAESAVLGRSPAMVELLRQARRAAASDATVLITGETGVGKSLLARAIHGWSRRKNGPFAAVNIADLPATLVESELFGHERGAFTGAAQRRTGRFELADGGTLFLDEIGEAPLAVQSKLLRVTQEGCLERVGGSATIRTDVRIVAATHRDLHEAVARGEFRRDLLYRLEIVALHVPPLRHRAEDLAPLTEAILARLSRKQGRPLRLSPAAWSRLHAHAWPGNVRELESVLLRAAVLEERDDLELASLNPGRAQAMAPPADDWPTRDEHERRYLLRVLEHTGGRIEGPQGAARLLGMMPSTLRSRARRLGLDMHTARVAGRS